MGCGGAAGGEDVATWRARRWAPRKSFNLHRRAPPSPRPPRRDSHVCRRRGGLWPLHQAAVGRQGSRQGVGCARVAAGQRPSPAALRHETLLLVPSCLTLPRPAPVRLTTRWSSSRAGHGAVVATGQFPGTLVGQPWPSEAGRGGAGLGRWRWFTRSSWERRRSHTRTHTYTHTRTCTTHAHSDAAHVLSFNNIPQGWCCVPASAPAGTVTKGNGAPLTKGPAGQGVSRAPQAYRTFGGGRWQAAAHGRI